QVVCAIAVHTHDAAGVPRPATELAVHSLSHTERLAGFVQLVHTLLIHTTHTAHTADQLRVDASLVIAVVVVQVIRAVAVLRRHTCTVPPSPASEPCLHLVAHLVPVAANTAVGLAIVVCGASIGACGGGRGRGNGVSTTHTRRRNSSLLVSVL